MVRLRLGLSSSIGNLIVTERAAMRCAVSSIPRVIGDGSLPRSLLAPPRPNRAQSMSNITQARRALVTRILEGEGTTSPPQRRAAFDNAGLAKPLNTLIN